MVFALSFRCFLLVSAARGLPDPYTVPEPLVEVLSPKGLRVSIPHEEGITLFAFHGNVNVPLAGLEAGQMSKDVLHKKGSRWVYENRRVGVRAGDEIYYWLYVLRNNLGYRLDDGYYKVPDNPLENSSPGLHFSTNTTANETHGLQHLLDRIANLQQEVKLLLETVENQPNSKTLTLNGSIPKEDDADLTVRSVIENLNVQASVDSADRNPDGSITFTVASPSEKLKLLKAAREKLEGTGITLS